MMKIKDEQRKQLKAMAEKMMARRSGAVKDNETQTLKDGNAQRVKLKLAAKRMNNGSKSSSENQPKSRPKSRGKASSESESIEFQKSPKKSARRSSSCKVTRRFSLGGLENLENLTEKSPIDLDESSVSTYTTLEASLNASYNGSLETSSISLLNSSMSGNGSSSLSRMLGSSQPDSLDCSFFLIISNIWETVKRMDGYTEDLAEHIICQMMTLEPEIDVRRQLALKSFRSSRFTSLARKLIEVVEILVTMIGPDVDEDELLEIGERLRMEGVQPKLFGRAIALAMRDLLGEEAFPKDDFDAWRKAFVFVCKKMDG